jgi:hypothetical protein
VSAGAKNLSRFAGNKSTASRLTFFGACQRNSSGGRINLRRQPVLRTDDRSANIRIRLAFILFPIIAAAAAPDVLIVFRQILIPRVSEWFGWVSSSGLSR